MTGKPITARLAGMVGRRANTDADFEPSLKLIVQYGLAADALPTRAQFRRWVRAALLCNAEVTLRIVDEEEGRQLNQSYRGKDYATNVLTFGYGAALAGQPLIADIALCAPVLAREAHRDGKTLLAHYAHLTVHGVLHMQGYDHEKATEAVIMETCEVGILAQLGLSNPY